MSEFSNLKPVSNSNLTTQEKIEQFHDSRNKYSSNLADVMHNLKTLSCIKRHS